MSDKPRYEKKPRGDCTLHRLPEDVQATVAEYGNRHTLKETQAWIRETQGLELSTVAISRWLSLYPLRQRFKSAREVLEEVARVPELTNISPEELEQKTRAMFQTHAIQNDTPELFLRFEKQRIEAEKLVIERRKLDLLEAKWAAARKALEAPATAEEKEARMREIFGLVA
jgi:hypothetical protein